MAGDWDGETVAELIVGDPSGSNVTIKTGLSPELQAFYSGYTFVGNEDITMMPSAGNAYFYMLVGAKSDGSKTWAAGWVDESLVVHESITSSYYPLANLTQIEVGDDNGSSAFLFNSNFVQVRGAYTEFLQEVQFEQGGSVIDENAHAFMRGETGVETYIFPAATIHAATVTFDKPFNNPPIITLNIPDFGVETRDWYARADTITTTSFRLTLTLASGLATRAWTTPGHPVQWVAVEPS